MFKKFRHSRAGFTLIELLVGMTIFSMALTSIYLLLNSTMKSVSYSRNEIIVSNLLREQIELVRNIRDSNIAKGAGWDVFPTLIHLKKSVIMIENDYLHTDAVFGGPNGEISVASVKVNEVNEISDKVWDLENNDALQEKFNKTQLCFDGKKRYVHCMDEAHKTASWTIFASYIHIEPMYYEEGGTKEIIREEKGDPDSKPQWYIIDARVIVRDGANYREYDAKTAITDWQR